MTSSPGALSARGATVVLLLLALSSLARPACSQTADSTARRIDVAGAVTITNKGISTIPSFTLGKPAAILDVSIANGGLRFEPQFKVGLDGKPWAFLFWGRYRLLEGGKLRVDVGAHPALSFKTMLVSTNGASREVIVARRYLAGELSPSYSLSRRVSVGAYYLYSHGVGEDVTKHTHFLAARANLTNIRLSDRYAVRLDPQVYYLRADDEHGYYVNAAATLARRDFPFSISAMVNEPIRTSIAAGEDFLWNVSLRYAIR